MAKATERVVRYQAPQVGGWTIPREGAGNIFLAEKLIPRTSQKGLADYSKGGLGGMSLPEHFELFDAIYQLRDKGGDVNNVLGFVRNSLRNSPLISSTRVFYVFEGKDKIIHGYGTEKQREQEVGVFGQRGEALEILTNEASLALTGKSPEEIVELANFINGNSAYVWGLGGSSHGNDERVVGLFADSRGLGINADWDARIDVLPAFAARFESKTGGKQ